MATDEGGQGWRLIVSDIKKRRFDGVLSAAEIRKRPKAAKPPETALHVWRDGEVRVPRFRRRKGSVTE